MEYTVTIEVTIKASDRLDALSTCVRIEETLSEKYGEAHVTKVHMEE
jgi:hypothetical protein